MTVESYTVYFIVTSGYYNIIIKDSDQNNYCDGVDAIEHFMNKQYLCVALVENDKRSRY